MNFLRFAYVPILYGAGALLIAALFYRLRYYRNVTYLYPVTQLLPAATIYQFPYKKFLSFLRFIILLGLALLAARPQLVDQQSKVFVQGIDIMLALDVSGSMMLFDDLTSNEPRIDIAKKEAIKFIKKRDNDPMGLVLFGQDAVTRVPLTLDKQLLEAVVDQTKLGDINPEGTVLCRGILMAINRLKNSTAKSRVIVVLTDGEPSPDDEQSAIVIELAKKYGIKLYTIGIGGPDGGYCHSAFGIQAFNIPFNTKLLTSLANETGGRSFLATNQQELEAIYEAINQLEKTEYESNVFQNYQDILMPYLWILIALICSEIVLSQTIWFGL